MDRVVAAIERTAGCILAVVALLIFASVALRYGFATNLPDNFDFSRYLQGIVILWGLAIATYRDGHISVDLLWEAANPQNRRLIDAFAQAVTALFVGLFAWVMVGRLPSVIDSNQVTNDLALPLWPFFLAGVLGAVACALVAVLRLFRIATARPHG